MTCGARLYARSGVDAGWRCSEVSEYGAGGVNVSDYKNRIKIIIQWLKKQSGELEKYRNCTPDICKQMSLLCCGIHPRGQHTPVQRR